MLAALLHSVWQYQLFKSVVFRGGMAFLTAYLLIVWIMPLVIRSFRKRGITSDFIKVHKNKKPYSGPPPIMGGGVLVIGILLGAILWCNLNQYVVALLVIMISFGIIGAADDVAKVFNKRRIESGKDLRKVFVEKADGISGRWRLIFQFIVSSIVVAGLYLFVDIDGHLVVPLIPLKMAYPYLPKYLFIPLMILIIVGGANAVNLTDGMDSLATVPLMTCAMFVGIVAYIGGDQELATKLKIPTLSHDIKELAVISSLIISAGVAFLKYNSPPALIYMGDLGALALGSMISAMFIFVKAELFLPIVGGVFVFSVLSSIIQRIFFKIVMWKKGRSKAERYRFFLRSPYHHHLQRLWTYSEEKQDIVSVWVIFQNKLGLNPVPEENKLLSPQEVNSRVIWHMHLKSVWLFVLTLIIYFKVR